MSGKRSPEKRAKTFLNSFSQLFKPGHTSRSKSGLLIQVNSIIASVLIGLLITNPKVYLSFEQLSSFLLAIPVATILLFAAATIFLGILASKPIGKRFRIQENAKERFFFGSFDRLDPNFKNVSWKKYSSDIDELFRSDIKDVIDELITESFQVRKILSKKFQYLAFAYKTFFAGFLASILALIFAFIYGT